MVTTIAAVGTAASPQTVRLSPQTAGRIVFLQAREGDRVAVGETLVRVDPAQIEGTVLQNQAAVSEARSRLAQAQATIGSGDVAVQSAIRTGGANVASAKAKLDQAKKSLQAQVAAAQAAVIQQTAAARSAQADVAAAEASQKANQATFESAQVRYTRTKGLFEGGYIAAQDVDDARAQQEAARGQVEVARDNALAAKARVAQSNAQRNAAQAQVTVVRRSAESAILTARADLRSAEATLASASANTTQGSANRRNVEALQASVRAAEGQLGVAQAQRANTELKSPIEGTVTERTADPGTLAQPGTPVMTIQVLKKMFVESSFPIELAAQVREGGEAIVTFDNLPDHKYTGRIADVNQAADAQSRQFTVRVMLDNADETIRPGMFGQVSIVTSRTNPSVVVPLAAVTATPDGKSTVAVVDREGTVTVRDVTVGSRDEMGVVIIKGVEAGDRVVTARAKPVKDGAKVNVTDANAKPPSGGRKARGGPQ